MLKSWVGRYSLWAHNRLYKTEGANHQQQPIPQQEGSGC